MTIYDDMLITKWCKSINWLQLHNSLPFQSKPDQTLRSKNFRVRCLCSYSITTNNNNVSQYKVFWLDNFGVPVQNSYWMFYNHKAWTTQTGLTRLKTRPIKPIRLLYRKCNVCTEHWIHVLLKAGIAYPSRVPGGIPGFLNFFLVFFMLCA